MAVPKLTAIDAHRRSSEWPTAAAPLFERLPDRLFGPLASANRHRYWALLCRLHGSRFGPSAPLAPSRGYPIRAILQDIEDELLNQDLWESEDGHAPETPIGIRANAVFMRLTESGWLRVERYGVEKTVTMQPAVSHFLTLMVSFAETGPVFLSGKIRSIEALLKSITEGDGAGDSLAEAADQARNLLEHVRNTSTSVRDLMESLSAETTTAQYVHRFFGDYIERVFIGDYRDLRTREHPLSHRPQIIARIQELHGVEAHRLRLIAWYESKRARGDHRQAEHLFERDINRLFELQRIDDYLDRLDDEIRRANKRALAYLDYRLRSLRPVDHMVSAAVAAVTAGAQPQLSDPFAPGDLVGPGRLAVPRRQSARPTPVALRSQVPSDLERARSQLMLRAREARAVTPPKLAEFVRRQLDGRDAVDSEEMTLSSIADVRAYQELMSISLMMGAKSRQLQQSAVGRARGFWVRAVGAPEQPHALISGVPFTIEVHSAKGKTS